MAYLQPKLWALKKHMLAPKLEISLPKMAVIMFSQHDADGVRMAMEWEVSLPKTRLQQLQLMAALCLLPFWEEAPWSLPWFGFQVGAHGHWPGAAFSWECHLCNGVQFLGNWPPMVSHSHYKLGWLDFWSWWAKSKTCIPVWNTFGTTTLGFHPPPIWSSQWWLVGLACGTPWVCHTGLLLLGWQLLDGLLHLGSPALGPWWLDRSWRLWVAGLGVPWDQNCGEM